VSARDASNVVATIADDAKIGSVVLRGVTVPLGTDVGQAFIADCARHTEGLVSDSDIKTKWTLTDEDWVGLAANTQLLRAVAIERERRVFNGVAAREGAQRYFAKAPNVLGALLTNEMVSPHNQIEAAKELRQIAGDGAEAASRTGEKFNIVIITGTETIRVEGGTTVSSETSPSDDGEVL